MARKSRRQPRNTRPGERATRGTRRGFEDGDRVGEKGWLIGRHAGLGAIANPARDITRIVMAAGDDALLAEINAAVGASERNRPQVEQKDRPALDQIAGSGAVHQGLMVQVKPLDDVELADVLAASRSMTSAAIVVLDQATDPRNIGAVMRSAAAFGALCVVVQDRHAPEMTAAMAKAASGAAETMPLVRVTNIARAIEDMKKEEFWAIGMDGAANEVLGGNVMAGRVCIVLGAEGAGLRRLVLENCDKVVKIPISGQMESLNLSNAAAIALYAFQVANSGANG